MRGCSTVGNGITLVLEKNTVPRGPQHEERNEEIHSALPGKV